MPLNEFHPAVRTWFQATLGERHTVQERLARATALVGAGKAYIKATLQDAWEQVTGGERLGPELGLPVQLAASHAVEAACQAVDLVHVSAGTTAIRNEHRFQQYFRDVHTISQHAFVSPYSRFESVGKLLLGKETDWMFFTL